MDVKNFDFKNQYKQIAARLFNKLVEPHLGKFDWVKPEIKKADLNLMLREYISMCLLATLISLPIWLVFTFLLLAIIGFPSPLLSSLLLTFLLTIGTFFLTLEYPTMKARDRSKNIDNNLPFACLYMNTIAGTGAPPDVIFKFLSNFKEYGQVSIEAQKIMEDVEIMGEDIEHALRRAARTTPSENFRDLLWGMITTIVQGGDLKALLESKAQTLMDIYRRKLDDFTTDVSMYVEVYITLVIVGSIFSIVMMTIMGAISGFGTLQAVQTLMVYVFLPVASIIFIFLIRLISPLSR